MFELHFTLALISMILCSPDPSAGKQLDEMQAGKQELVVKYEEQLQHVKDEV